MNGVASAIGWISTAILIATLARQTFVQWRSTSAEGVSTWLFIGQIAASLGFVTYSALLGNAVFIVTNVLVLITALVGQAVTWTKRRRLEREAGA